MYKRQVSDYIFRSRRKPTMMITALGTAILMAIVLVVPQNTLLLATCLFLTGFCLNLGWSTFTSYGMNVTTTRTYPFAISIINSGGNLGGFFAPMIVGALLDAKQLHRRLLLLRRRSGSGLPPDVLHHRAAPPRGEDGRAGLIPATRRAASGTAATRRERNRSWPRSGSSPTTSPEPRR